MDIQAPLSGAELATPEAIDGPYGHNTTASDTTARLIGLGFVKATALSFYVTRAGRLRLTTERLLDRERRSSDRPSEKRSSL